LKPSLRTHVHIVEPGKKAGAVFARQPISDDMVEEFVHPNVFSARRFGSWNDEVGDDGCCGVLMWGKCFERRSWRKRGVNFTEGGEKLRGKGGGKRGATGEQLQDFTSIQDIPQGRIQAYYTVKEEKRRNERRSRDS
jgi:hypothetical protein